MKWHHVLNENFAIVTQLTTGELKRIMEALTIFGIE